MWLAYAPFVLLLLAWLACCKFTRSGPKRLLCFVVLFGASMVYLVWGLPQLSDLSTGEPARGAAPAGGQSTGSKLAAAYRKYTSDQAGTLPETRGNVDDLMQKMRQIETVRFAANTAGDPDFSHHAEQLHNMGMRDVESMSTMIQNDVMRHSSADRNVSAMKPESFTAPAVVGQYATKPDQVIPQQKGESLARAVGFSAVDQLNPGPRAGEQEGLPRIEKDSTAVVAAAEKAGVMDRGDGSSLDEVFAMSTMATPDDAAGEEAIARAISDANA